MTGLSDPTRVLDAIDATVDGMCACGCTWPVDQTVSAWFAGPACQQRWYAAQADRPMRDGGRAAGIGPGWGSDQAGPEGGARIEVAPVDRIDLSSVPVPLGSPYLDFWTELIARGEVYVVNDGGQPRPEWVARAVSAATESTRRELALPFEWQVEYDTSPLRSGRPEQVTFTLTPEQQQQRAADAFQILRQSMEEIARAWAAVLGPVMAEARMTLASGARALIDLGLIDEPPVDEREATLRAVRARRNSGPARPVRAVRRIDPRGGAPRR